MTQQNSKPLEIEGFAEEEDRTLSAMNLPETLTEPFNPNEIHIIPQTLSIDSLIARIKNDEIDLHTEFQRKANLWKPDVQSRLIESLMLRLPLPAFYFDANEDDKWLIVDGLQRLSALKNFIIDESLSLTGLDILKDYDNKSVRFSDLPRTMQRRIIEANVTCFLINPGTPKKVKYNVFKRINTGALALNEMEVRNALNQGNASAFLKNFTEDEKFRRLIRLPNERMEDRELVLRCIAFMQTSYLQYKSPLGSFLDRAMEKLQSTPLHELEEIAKSILRGIEIHTVLFGKKRFSRSILSKGIRYRLNSALFETWVVILSNLPSSKIEKIYSNSSALIEEYKKLFEDKSFNDSITTSTASQKAVLKRFSAIESLIQKYTL